MRINFPCEKCTTWFTLQMPDGIGEMAITIECPCGNTFRSEFVSPKQEGGLVLIHAEEHVGTTDKVGG